MVCAGERSGGRSRQAIRIRGRPTSGRAAAAA